MSLDSTASQLEVASANLVLSPMPPSTPKITGTSDLDQQHWWHLEEVSWSISYMVH